MIKIPDNYTEAMQELISFAFKYMDLQDEKIILNDKHIELSQKHIELQERHSMLISISNDIIENINDFNKKCSTAQLVIDQKIKDKIEELEELESK